MPRPARKTTKKNVLTMPMAASPALAADPTQADVAKRAFELYCARGCQHGHDVQDWLQAERELLASRTTAA